MHQAFRGEACQAVIGKGRDFRLVDIQPMAGFGLRKVPLMQNLVDSKCEAGSSLALFGISEA